jgi:hypothetical protein
LHTLCSRDIRRPCQSRRIPTLQSPAFEAASEFELQCSAPTTGSTHTTRVCPAPRQHGSVPLNNTTHTLVHRGVKKEPLQFLKSGTNPPLWTSRKGAASPSSKPLQSVSVDNVYIHHYRGRAK